MVIWGHLNSTSVVQNDTLDRGGERGGLKSQWSGPISKLLPLRELGSFLGWAGTPTHPHPLKIAQALL